MLLAFGEWAVGGERLVAADADDGRRARRVQARREDPRSGGLQVAAPGLQAGHDRLEYLRWRRIAVGLVDAQQILLHRWSSLGAGLPVLSGPFTSYTNADRSHRQDRAAGLLAAGQADATAAAGSAGASGSCPAATGSSADGRR